MAPARPAEAAGPARARRHHPLWSCPTCCNTGNWCERDACRICGVGRCPPTLRVAPAASTQRPGGAAPLSVIVPPPPRPRTRPGRLRQQLPALPVRNRTPLRETTARGLSGMPSPRRRLSSLEHASAPAPSARAGAAGSARVLPPSPHAVRAWGGARRRGRSCGGGGPGRQARHLALVLGRARTTWRCCKSPGRSWRSKQRQRRRRRRGLLLAAPPPRPYRRWRSRHGLPSGLGQCRRRRCPPRPRPARSPTVAGACDERL